MSELTTGAGRKKLSKGAKIAIIVVAIILIIVIVGVSAFFIIGAIGNNVVGPDERMFTYSGFQKPISSAELSKYSSHEDWISEADIKALYDEAAAGDPDKLIKLMFAAQQNYSIVNQRAQFVNTWTDIKMTDDNAKPFEVLQYSSYTEVTSQKGYFERTASGMLELETKLGPTIGGIVKKVAGFASRYYEDYETSKKYYQGEAGGISKFDAWETEMAGIEVNYNSATSVEDIVDNSGKYNIFKYLKPDGINLTGEEGITDLVINTADDKIIYNSETQRYEIKEEGGSKEYYYYIPNDQYYYRDIAKLWNEHVAKDNNAEKLEKADENANYLWDDYRQAYSPYVRDGNWATPDQASGKGKAHPQNWSDPVNGVSRSMHTLTTDTVDASKSTFNTEGSGNNAYYVLKIAFNKDYIDLATRYNKAAIISDTNAFIEPYNVEYTDLEMEIHIWTNGLFKMYNRIEYYNAEGDVMRAQLGSMGFGHCAGSATNTSKEVFSYDAKDYDMTQFTKKDVWNLNKARPK